MIRLLLLTLLLPFALNAQTFEIGAQAGYLNTRSIFFKDRNMGGLSGNVTFRCFLTKHLAVSAFYDHGAWPDLAADKKTSVKAVSHSFGLAPHIIFKHWFIGHNIQLISFRATMVGTYRFGPAIGLGLYAGARQKIIKRLSVTEQIGYDRIPTATASPPKYTPGFTTQLPKAITRFYIRAGLVFTLK